MYDKRFPRSTLEAFGVDATTACAIERHRPIEAAFRKALAIAVIGAMGAFIGFAIVF